MKLLNIFAMIVTVQLVACGGGGSSNGGGESTEDVLRQFTIREIQFFIGDQGYQPSQAEIDCVQALPRIDDTNLHGQRVVDCVNNN